LKFLSVAKAYVVWFVWLLLSRILPLFSLKVNYLLSTVCSRLFYTFDRRWRNTVEKDICKLFGDRIDKNKIKKVVRSSFDIFFKRQVENIIFETFTKERVNSMVSFEGIENLEGVLREGKGAILLLSHFGSFLLPPLALGHRGYKVFQVGKEPINRTLDRKIFELRKSAMDKLPINFIQSSQYLGSVVKALKGNGIVVIAFDGRAGNKFIPVNFFDRIAEFSPGPFRLAIRTGATILPTFTVRKKDDHHRIIIEPPLELEITNDNEETLKINTVKYVKIFERYLLDYPCHFAMILYSLGRAVERGLNRPLFVDRES